MKFATALVFIATCSAMQLDLSPANEEALTITGSQFDTDAEKSCI